MIRLSLVSNILGEGVVWPLDGSEENKNVTLVVSSAEVQIIRSNREQEDGLRTAERKRKKSGKFEIRPGVDEKAHLKTLQVLF